MRNVLALAEAQPMEVIAPGHVLITQGSQGGDLFILEEGRLSVARDGVKIANVITPGALIGEMSVLLGTPSSATVKAETEARVRVIRNARAVLERDPELTLQVASLVASRLDTTSAFLVGLTKEYTGRTEQGLLARIVSMVHRPAGSDDAGH
jgi:CRP/FNR family transcriptional regulator, cyclic AMP receptor protein